ncbi:MAG: hypothetical protein Q4B63_01285 [Clostridium perfringens]|nr:hypothetical protein [Clostridium perfringens]
MDGIIIRRDGEEKFITKGRIRPFQLKLDPFLKSSFEKRKIGKKMVKCKVYKSRIKFLKNEYITNKNGDYIEIPKNYGEMKPTIFSEALLYMYVLIFVVIVNMAYSLATGSKENIIVVIISMAIGFQLFGRMKIEYYKEKK